MRPGTKRRSDVLRSERARDRPSMPRTSPALSTATKEPSLKHRPSHFHYRMGAHPWNEKRDPKTSYFTLLPALNSSEQRRGPPAGHRALRARSFRSFPPEPVVINSVMPETWGQGRFQGGAAPPFGTGGHRRCHVRCHVPCSNTLKSWVCKEMNTPNIWLVDAILKYLEMGQGPFRVSRVFLADQSHCVSQSSFQSFSSLHSVEVFPRSDSFCRSSSFISTWPIRPALQPLNVPPFSAGEEVVAVNGIDVATMDRRGSPMGPARSLVCLGNGGDHRDAPRRCEHRPKIIRARWGLFQMSHVNDWSGEL